MEYTITKFNFESEVINSDIPVLVDFWATWCGPCRMIAGEISKIAEKYEGKIKVGKVNVDEEGELAIKFNIDAIPAIYLFKDGKVVNKIVGFVSAQEIEKIL